MHIVYNVTVKIENVVKDDWYRWMREVHIPDVMKTGCFLESRLSRILGEDETGGVTWSVQYIAPDMKTFNTYQQQYAPDLQREHTERYRGHYVAFRTLLEVHDTVRHLHLN